MDRVPVSCCTVWVRGNSGSVELELHFSNPAFRVFTNSQVVKGKFFEVKVRR